MKQLMILLAFLPVALSLRTATCVFDTKQGVVTGLKNLNQILESHYDSYFFNVLSNSLSPGFPPIPYTSIYLPTHPPFQLCGQLMIVEINFLSTSSKPI
jgi:hypothetical protein